MNMEVRRLLQIEPREIGLLVHEDVASLGERGAAEMDVLPGCIRIRPADVVLPGGRATAPG